VHIMTGRYTLVSASFSLKYKADKQIVTGILLAESAISILRDNHKLPGGIYTPASLGQKFIDRLQSKGFKFEKKFYD
jgi:short subunit dehydrogenase-like uncharacterized protein